MTTVVIANVVLDVLIVVAVLTLLGWGIVTDKAWAATRPTRPFKKRSPTRSRTPARTNRARSLASGER